MFRPHKLFVALGALAGMLLSLAESRAHRAPSGWAYDHECCHNLDCAPAAAGAVREVAGGYAVLVAPGTHPMVPAGAAPVAGFVPHGDRRIRPSGDAERNVCIIGGRVFCLYVPPGGV